MKASELRIGNLVNEIATGICAANIYVISFVENANIKNHQIDRYTAIPLTEEWLLRFGCRPNETNDTPVNYWNSDKDFSVDVETVLSDNGVQNLFYYRLAPERSKHLIYVHQLQNLYFALTGTEL